MALIRHAQARDLARDAVALDLGDLQDRGDRLRKQAMAEAEKIIREAHAERERLISDASKVGHKQGYEEGVAIGFKEGRERGRAEAVEQATATLGSLEDSWLKTLAEFEARRDDLHLSAREDLLRLSLTIAERVIARAIRTDPTVVAAQIESCLSMVMRPTRVIVGVHPDDAEIAEATMPRLLARFTACEHAELRHDESVERGSVRLTTDRGGELGSPLAAQLREIARLLLPGESAEAAFFPDDGVDDEAAQDAGSAGLEVDEPPVDEEPGDEPADA